MCSLGLFDSLKGVLWVVGLRTALASDTSVGGCGPWCEIQGRECSPELLRRARE